MSAAINTQAAPPPVQKMEPVKQKNKILKIGIIGLVIILIIILSEVGYLVFNGYGRTYFQLKSQSQEEIANSPTPSPIPNSPTSPTFTLSKDSNFQQNKLNDFLFMINGLSSKESFIQTVVINTSFKAIVVSTSREENSAKYTINAKNDSGQTIEFKFSSQEMDSAKIYLTSNSTENISFDDIKEGDILTVKVASDLLDSSPDSKLILEIERAD